MSDRMLQVEQAIRIVILQSKAELLAAAGRDREQIEKAKHLVHELERPEFWKLLKEYVISYPMP